MRLYVSSQVEAVVHRAAEILLAAEVTLCGLHRDVPEQELNLLQLTTAVVAQFRAGSSQIVRRDMLQPHSLATALHDVPDDILRDTLSPFFPCSGNGAEHPSRSYLCCVSPLVECRFDPLWNGDGADVPGLADQIHDCPMPLTDLDLIQFHTDQFRSAKTTPKEHRQHGVVSFGTHASAERTSQNL